MAGAVPLRSSAHRARVGPSARRTAVALCGARAQLARGCGAHMKVPAQRKTPGRFILLHDGPAAPRQTGGNAPEPAANIVSEAARPES